MSEEYVEESKRAQDAFLRGMSLVSRKAEGKHEPYPYCCPEHYPMPMKEQKPMSKHDGDLGSGYTVAMHYDNVEIRDGGAEFAALAPAQAIKLLAWLEEEYPNLWRLMKR